MEHGFEGMFYLCLLRQSPRLGGECGYHAKVKLQAVTETIHMPQAVTVIDRRCKTLIFDANVYFRLQLRLAINNGLGLGLVHTKIACTLLGNVR